MCRPPAIAEGDDNALIDAALPIYVQSRHNALRIFGYWLVCFSTLGIQYAYGALYVQFLERLHGSRGLTALVGSLADSRITAGVIRERVAEAAETQARLEEASRAPAAEPPPEGRAVRFMIEDELLPAGGDRSRRQSAGERGAEVD